MHLDSAEDENNVCNSPEDFQCLVSNQAQIFSAKLYSNPKLPRSHVQNIIDDVSTVITSTIGCKRNDPESRQHKIHCLWLALMSRKAITGNPFGWVISFARDSTFLNVLK
ncbi:Hypothetical predicted protein, partial [Olea europaea subsp. europaea]